MQNPNTHSLANGTSVDEEITILSIPNALAIPGMEVDHENAVLRNVAIITEGPALGHDFTIDATTIKQVVAAIKKTGSIKSHLTHPYGEGAPLIIGGITNPRVDGDMARGDLEIGEWAEHSGLGNMKKWLLSIASTKPEYIGNSIRFARDLLAEDSGDEDEPKVSAARIKNLISIDVVGDPAANRHGFLSSQQEKSSEKSTDSYLEGNAMDPKMKMLLVSLGMQDTIEDDAGFIAFVETLSATQKTEVEKLKAEVVELSAKATDKNAEPEKEEPEKEATLSAVDLEAAKKEAIELERKRVNEITQLAARTPGIDKAFADKMIADGNDISTVNELALKRMEITMAPYDIEVGDDNNETSLRDGMSDALCLKMGFKPLEINEYDEVVRDDNGKAKLKKIHGRARQFRQQRLIEMGRGFLKAQGVVGVDYWSESKIAQFFLNPDKARLEYGMTSLAMGATDLPYIMADAMNKSMRKAYDESEPTWPEWCAEREVADFKDIKEMTLSEVQNLTLRRPGDEVDFFALTESRETAALEEYTTGLIFTRQMLINDDLGALSDIAIALADAAVRKEEIVTVAVINANGAMNDGSACFSGPAHGNDSGTAALIAETSLGSGFEGMMMQRGVGNVAYLRSLVPEIVLIPPGRYTKANGIINPTLQLPGGQTTDYGSMKGVLKLIPVPLLQVTSATAWYMVTSPKVHPAIAIWFLRGERNPVVKSKIDELTDDHFYMVRHNLAAAMLDWRAWWRNTGL